LTLSLLILFFISLSTAESRCYDEGKKKTELIEVASGNQAVTIFFPLPADETENNSANYRKAGPEPAYMADSMFYRTLHASSDGRCLSQR
jgi:hypothetical protein